MCHRSTGTVDLAWGAQKMHTIHPQKAWKAKRAPLKRHEEPIHKAIASYLELVAPRREKASFIWFHVPNGGGRSKAESGILKSMGVLAGVPDIIILDRASIAYFGEIKPEGVDLSESQQTFETNLYSTCGPCARMDVWRSVDDCRASLTKWGLL